MGKIRRYLEMVAEDSYADWKRWYVSLSPERQEELKRKKRERAKVLRSMTPDERKENRAMMHEAKRRWFDSLSPEQKAEQSAKNRMSIMSWLASLSPDERESVREKQRATLAETMKKMKEAASRADSRRDFDYQDSDELEVEVIQ